MNLEAFAQNSTQGEKSQRYLYDYDINYITFTLRYLPKNETLQLSSVSHKQLALRV